MDEKRTLKKWRYGLRGWLFILAIIPISMAFCWLVSLTFILTDGDFSVESYEGEDTLIVPLTVDEKVEASCDCALEFEASSYTQFKAIKNQVELPLTTVDLAFDDVPAIARRDNLTVYLVARTPYRPGPYVFDHKAFTEPIDIEFFGEGKIIVTTTLSDETVADKKEDNREFQIGMIKIGLFFGVIFGILVCEVVCVPPNIRVPNTRP